MAEIEARAEARSVINKLNSVNYSSWSYQIKLVLMENDLWTTVRPGEIKPDDTEVEKLRKYVSRQGKALAKICLAIGDEQQQHVQHLNSPKDVWEELERLYAPKDSKFRIVQLRRKLYSEKLGENDNMDSYLGRINRAVTELINIGDKIEDSDLSMTILCGLPEDWDVVVSAICNLPELEFTCANVKRRLLAESARRNATTTKEADAMSIRAEKRQEERKQTSRERRIVNKSDIIRFKCGAKGHYAKQCSNKTLHQRQIRHNKGGKRPGYDMLLTCNTIKDNTSDIWIVDSGATHHMTPNEGYFSRLEKENCDIEKVTTANGTTVTASGKGTAHVKIINSRGLIDEFTAKNTVYVPEIKHNVLSVLQMTENKRKVVFDSRGCHVYDRKGNVLMEAEKQDRLFVINTKPGSGDAETRQSLLLQGKKESLELWHKRFMHVNYDTILKMCETDIVRGLNCATTKPSKCDDCLRGKSSRRPFSKHPMMNTQPENEPLNLVHSDLMGPLDVESWGGAKYVLTIIDDSTRYVRVYFLRRKGDVLEKFKEWMREAERQTQKTLKRVRTDNGLEYCSNAWDTFCKAYGIVHERTMVYTPQQNGVAERMNRTLLDLVRSTISDSGLPKASWAELVHTAAYIRNRVTNTHNNKITPYELWFQRKPSVRHLRACGCDTFVHIPKEVRRSKLDKRSYRGRLVGYALKGRGWRIWVPEKHCVIESRDCVFREDMTAHLPSRVSELPIVEFYNENQQEENDDDQDEVTNSEEAETPIQQPEPMRQKQTKDRLTQRIHPMTLRHMSETRNDPEEPTPVNTSAEVNVTEQQRKMSNPGSYLEAIQDEDAACWLEAMQEEITSMNEHDVWELKELPKGIKPVKCKWILTKKTGPGGEIVRYKARLVAKGFSQREGIDYEEVYAPVSSFETTRLLTAIAVEEGWITDQYDIKCAYLNGHLDQEIYMEQPEGFTKPGEEKLYCKLKKSIYGLKQSSKCWNECLDKRLKEAGFMRNPVDPCVYEITKQEGRAILSVYVDDIFCISQNEKIQSIVKNLLQTLFQSRSMGPVSYLLGVKFDRTEGGGMMLSQRGYVDELLERFNMENAKEATTPMEVRPNFLDTSITNNQENEHQNLPYCELIGALLYLSQRTRPDIAFVVNKLARYCANYNRRHWDAAKRVLRYLKATKDAGITYKKVGRPLVAFTDADWATCPESRRSTSGYVIMLANAPVAWRSTRQTVVALSTMEAEYVALADCTRETMWIGELLQQLHFNDLVRMPIQIQCDSQAAISHANNHIDRSRTKHIAIRHHFVRDRINEEKIKLKHVSTELNIADIFTKSLSKVVHKSHSEKLVTVAKCSSQVPRPLRGGVCRDY